MLGRQECGPEAGPEVRLPGSARSQLVHYLKGMPGAASAREQLVRLNTLGEALSVLERLRQSCESAAARGARELVELAAD